MAQDNNPEQPRSIDERLHLLATSTFNLRETVAELYTDVKQMRDSVAALERASAAQLDSVKRIGWLEQ